MNFILTNNHHVILLFMLLFVQTRATISSLAEQAAKNESSDMEAIITVRNDQIVKTLSRKTLFSNCTSCINLPCYLNYDTMCNLRLYYNNDFQYVSFKMTVKTPTKPTWFAIGFNNMRKMIGTNTIMIKFGYEFKVYSGYIKYYNAPIRNDLLISNVVKYDSDGVSTIYFDRPVSTPTSKNFLDIHRCNHIAVAQGLLINSNYPGIHLDIPYFTPHCYFLADYRVSFFKLIESSSMNTQTNVAAHSAKEIMLKKIALNKIDVAAMSSAKTIETTTRKSTNDLTSLTEANFVTESILNKTDETLAQLNLTINSIGPASIPVTDAVLNTTEMVQNSTFSFATSTWHPNTVFSSFDATQMVSDLFINDESLIYSSTLESSFDTNFSTLQIQSSSTTTKSIDFEHAQLSNDHMSNNTNETATENFTQITNFAQEIANSTLYAQEFEMSSENLQNFTTESTPHENLSNTSYLDLEEHLNNTDVTNELVTDSTTLLSLPTFSSIALDNQQNLTDFNASTSSETSTWNNTCLEINSTLSQVSTDATTAQTAAVYEATKEDYSDAQESTSTHGEQTSTKLSTSMLDVQASTRTIHETLVQNASEINATVNIVEDNSMLLNDSALHDINKTSDSLFAYNIKFDLRINSTDEYLKLKTLLNNLLSELLGNVLPILTDFYVRDFILKDDNVLQIRGLLNFNDKSLNMSKNELLNQVKSALVSEKEAKLNSNVFKIDTNSVQLEPFNYVEQNLKSNNVLIKIALSSVFGYLTLVLIVLLVLGAYYYSKRSKIRKYYVPHKLCNYQATRI